MLVTKGQILSLVQGSHWGHHWVSSLTSNGIVVCTVTQCSELGEIPVHSRGMGWNVAQAMQADLTCRTVPLAPLGWPKCQVTITIGLLNKNKNRKKKKPKTTFKLMCICRVEGKVKERPSWNIPLFTLKANTHSTHNTRNRATSPTSYKSIRRNVYKIVFAILKAISFSFILLSFMGVEVEAMCACRWLL